MSNEQKFVDGLRVYAPRDNAPDFIIANLVVNVAELQAWLAQRSGEVRIDIKESRGGKFYASENDYKPEGQRQQSQPAGNGRAYQKIGKPAGNSGIAGEFEDASGGFVDDQDIPFQQLGKRKHWVA